MRARAVSEMVNIVVIVIALTCLGQASLISAYSFTCGVPFPVRCNPSCCYSDSGFASNSVNDAGSQVNLLERRNLLLKGATLSLASIFSNAQTVCATPVRAPLPPGPADPLDKARLEEVAKFLDTVGPDLTNPDKWPSILEVLNKVISKLALPAVPSQHPVR